MGELCAGKMMAAKTFDNERDIEFYAEILVGGTSSECVFDALSFGGQMVMFRNRERVCGRLLCGSIPDNIIDCRQNNKICHIRVRDCT